MIGITLTTDQIRNAPREVRQWIEHQVITSLGLGPEMPAAAPVQAAHLVACSPEDAAAVFSQIQGLLAPTSVFFEFARPGVCYGQPPVMALRLIDILHHTKLKNVDQVMACLELINQALAQTRHDAGAKFCGFDHEGHCLIAPATQTSIAQLWQQVIAKQQAVPGSEAA